MSASGSMVSRYWPPIIPRVASASSRATCGVGYSHASRKASARSASPASTALPSPYAAQTLGLPRRSSSPSSAGRSSWTREKLCTSSIASAAGITCSGGASSASPTASEITGRMRLPPISTSAYRADSRWPASCGHSWTCSSASSTSARSSSAACIGFPLLMVDRLQQLLRRHLDLGQELDRLLQVGARLDLLTQLLEPGDLLFDCHA